MALVIGAVILSACQPPILGAPPALPAPGSSDPGPTPCPTTAAGVDFYGNLKYGHDVDQNQDLFLDARIPTPAGGPLPAIVYVHGGGHVGGSKCDGSSQVDYLAQHGFAVFSVGYPLASSTDHTSYDVPIDVELAVQWVRANAATFGVNPKAIGLWGGSAGVDIAYVAAYQAQRDNPAARVQAVAGWSGVYDFTDEFYRNPANSSHVGRSGGDYVGCTDPNNQGCVAAITAASPLTYASHDDPPSLVVASTDYAPGCESVEPQNAVQMSDALKERGVPVVLETTSACGHALAYWQAPIDPPGTGTMIDNLVAFFHHDLGGTPAPPTTPAPLPPPLTGVSIVTPSSTCTPTTPGITYTPNVVYGQDFGHSLYADVYRPAGTATHPAVVLVHGGNFTGGDKCDAAVTQVAIQLAQNGYVAFNVNYPLATAAQPTFPNPVYDVQDGIRTLKANATLYGIDPARIAVWGDDAGGNIATDAALTAPLIDPGATVAAAVEYSGPTDIFSEIGAYAAVGVTTPPDDFAAYIGCADPVTITWDPSANACFGLYQQASPALLTDPSARGTALLDVNSSDFNGGGTCELTPLLQAEELALDAGSVGVSAATSYPSTCATGFDLSTELPSTLAFLHAHLGP